MRVRLFVAMFAMASMLGLGLISAAGEGKGKPEDAKRGERGNPDELFTKLDANKDGKVTADEVTGDQKRLFDRIVSLGDKNSDGVLDKEEFAAGLKRPQQGDRPAFRPGGNERRPDAQQVFSRLDGNGDGKIQLDEVPAERRQSVERMLQFGDKNGDKAIDLEEFKAMQARMSGREGGRPGMPAGGQFGAGIAVFMVIDANGDGSLSSDEVAAATSVLRKLDKNGDGKIEGEELRPTGRPGAVGARPIPLAELDKDNDGKISKEEAPERLKQNFDRVDTNKDGFIDAAERKAIFERFQGQRPGQRPDGKKRPEGKRPEPNKKPADKKAEDK